MVAIFHADDPVTEPKELLVPHAAGYDGRGGSSCIDSYAVSEFDGSGATSQLANTSDGVLQTRPITDSESPAETPSGCVKTVRNRVRPATPATAPTPRPAGN